MLINATPGEASLGFFKALGAEALAGKVLIDVANAVTPSFDLMYPNDRLGEQLQAALPETRVVKAMNTAAMTVITAPGDLVSSSLFLAGDDGDAKAIVASLITDFGWPPQAIIDLGGIRSARGTEHYFLLFATLMQAGGPQFKIRIVP